MPENEGHSVLVIGESPFGKGEPVALGPVLSKWCAEIGPEGHIRELAVLQSQETLEAESGEEPMDLSRSMFNGIDQCLLESQTLGGLR